MKVPRTFRPKKDLDEKIAELQSYNHKSVDKLLVFCDEFFDMGQIPGSVDGV